jgi:PleD family two-component response regulator
MVLLPQVVLSVGQSVAERIREAIANAAFRGPAGKRVSLTVSIGVSQFGHEGDTIDEILRRRRAAVSRETSGPQPGDRRVRRGPVAGN